MNAEMTDMNILDGGIRDVLGAIDKFKQCAKSARDLHRDLIARLWEFSNDAFTNEQKRNVLITKFKACEKQGMPYLKTNGSLKDDNLFKPVILFFYGKPGRDRNGRKRWDIDTNTYRYANVLRWMKDNGV